MESRILTQSSAPPRQKFPIVCIGTDGIKRNASRDTSLAREVGERSEPGESHIASKERINW
ncbi:MAG: hypothetical protein GC165_03900 [Armatimonadetes bacterium]|nr:hypothetical protein [Armatimonadota bacterium]